MQEHLEILQTKWAAHFASLPSPYPILPLHSFEIQWNHHMRSRAGFCRPSENRIALYPHLLTEPQVLEEVFLHELCQLVVARRWRYARAHGTKWQNLMRLCGLEPKRCHDLPVPRKRQLRKWPAHCSCQKHELTTV